MNFKVIMHFIVMLFLLAGCKGVSGHKVKVSKGEDGFITVIADKKQILVKNTMYSIKKGTDIQDSAGHNLDISSLEIGMKAKVWYSGDMKESMPAQADAKLIEIQTDISSLEEQKAITAAINAAKKADSQQFMVLKCSYLQDQGVYWIEMMDRSNLDAAFVVTVDANSYEVLFHS
ncbi:DUF3221 domain-containing protein [Peribacillus sp. SCS-155]|uniref:DUF3221 domain-containing protein n=1 Tax=Peribacillus sedimenti TaxID=3115297 RepID=UPI0039069053